MVNDQNPQQVINYMLKWRVNLLMGQRLEIDDYDVLVRNEKKTRKEITFFLDIPQFDVWLKMMKC